MIIKIFLKDRVFLICSFISSTNLALVTKILLNFQRPGPRNETLLLITNDASIGEWSEEKELNICIFLTDSCSF